MTHIGKSHGSHSAHRKQATASAAKKDDDKKADDQPKAGGAKRQPDEVQFGSPAERRRATKLALDRHSTNKIGDWDKAFEMHDFKAGLRDKARLDAVKMNPPKTYKVVADDARVRTHPMGLVTANVKEGDRFVVEATRTDKKGNTWAWGYAAGDAKKPGWMPMKAGSTTVLKETEEKFPKGYEKAGEPMHQAKLWGLKYVDGKDKMKRGMDYTLRFEVKPGNENAKLYENIDAKGRPHGAMQKLKPGDVVRIRYTLDGEVAVFQRKSANDTDTHSKWGYVKLDDLQYAPLKKQ